MNKTPFPMLLSVPHRCYAWWSNIYGFWLMFVCKVATTMTTKKIDTHREQKKASQTASSSSHKNWSTKLAAKNSKCINRKKKWSRLGHKRVIRKSVCGCCVKALLRQKRTWVQWTLFSHFFFISIHFESEHCAKGVSVVFCEKLLWSARRCLVLYQWNLWWCKHRSNKTTATTTKTRE